MSKIRRKIRHVGIKMRIRPPKRRTPQQRLRARLYYRRNRAKVRLQRRRYLRRWKTVLTKRKLFKRFKPSWFKKPSKPKKIKQVHHIKPHKFHVKVHHIKPHKFHVKVPKPLGKKPIHKLRHA